MAEKLEIYRVCFECGEEWDAERLVTEHNKIVDEVNAFVCWGAELEGIPEGEKAHHVTTPEEVFCCPECTHDW